MNKISVVFKRKEKVSNPALLNLSQKKLFELGRVKIASK